MLHSVGLCKILDKIRDMRARGLKASAASPGFRLYVGSALSVPAYPDGRGHWGASLLAHQATGLSMGKGGLSGYRGNIGNGSGPLGWRLVSGGLGAP
jgi:hypothetical protein